MAPFADVPHKTASGLGPLADTDSIGIGTMPSACSLGNHETGNCIGIALEILDVSAGDLGTGAATPEAAVDNNGVTVVDAGAPTGVGIVDDALPAVVDVATSGKPHLVNPV
jgi:hypothetical protein